MNCVKELRISKGIQQKELAISLGVSQPTVSDWEKGKKTPRGENLRKLAEYFKVDEDFILGYGRESPNLFIPKDPKISGVSQTEQIVQHVLEKLNPKTPEARIIVNGVDKMPQEQRQLAVNVMKTIFSQYADYFDEKGTDEDDT